MCDDSFHKESENTGDAKMDDSGLEEAESGTLDSLSNPAHKLSESIEDTHFPDSKESSGIDLNDSNEQNCKDSTASPLKVKDHCSGDAAASCHVDSKKETSVGEDKTESIASNISKSANFLGGANTPDRNDDDNVADPDLPTETIASPTDPKKMKTSADIHTDDDSTGSNEYKDASDELSVTRMKRKHKLRNRNLESDDGGNDSEHNSSSSIHIDSSSSSSLSHSESKDEEVEDQVWLNEGILDLPPRKWHSVCSLRQRETLACTRYWTTKVCGSRAMTKRLELQWNLDKHNGCVNALHFNQSGTMLASGSDDLQIMLWDWTDKHSAPVLSYESGHKSNVFQAKFLRDCGDSSVVSSARDGQVRVADISMTGVCKKTRKVAQHRGSAHKLSLDVASSSTFLSCGEDGVVFGIDLRRDKPAEKLVTTKIRKFKVPLYSIHNNPGRPYEFAVSGGNNHARIYDRRMLRTNDDATEPVKRYCPHRLENLKTNAHITCLMYNWCGSELLCSYNDEDIYLFDTSHSSGADCIKRYKGHRNNATVKGVNFFGPRSEFVVSGSDCGNIFFWEKQSSRVVQLMEGDDGGVVNVLEPHPTFPIIATSGLDHDVKIWAPTAGTSGLVNQMPKLKECMLSNRQERNQDKQRTTGTIDGELIWFLMRTLRTRRRTDRFEQDGASSDEDIDEDSSDSSDSEEGTVPRCTQS